MKRGVASKMDLTFKTTEEATKLEGSIKAQIAGIWMSWPIPSKSADVCQNLIKGTCPVPANDEATYSLSFKIPGIAPPGTRTVVQLRVIDQNKKAVACTRFPVLVVS